MLYTRIKVFLNSIFNYVKQYEIGLNVFHIFEIDIPQGTFYCKIGPDRLSGPKVAYVNFCKQPTLLLHASQDITPTFNTSVTNLINIGTTFYVFSYDAVWVERIEAITYPTLSVCYATVTAYLVFIQLRINRWTEYFYPREVACRVKRWFIKKKNYFIQTVNKISISIQISK